MTKLLTKDKNESKEFEQCLAPVRAAGICMIQNSTIAGTRHVPGIAKIAEDLSVGDAVFFKRDPGNFFDEWAVGIYDIEGRRLGYLSCEHNEVVSRLMDGGKSILGRLRAKGRRDAWTKLEIEVILND